VAVAAGWGAALLFGGRGAEPGEPSAGRAKGRAAAAALLLAAALPGLLFLRELALRPESVLLVVRGHVFPWIRDNTPPTKGWDDTREAPGYAVFADWQYGHLVTWVSRRPVLANNFGYQLRGESLGEVRRVWLAPDEASLEAACRRRGIRYLLLTDVPRRSPELLLPPGAAKGARGPSPAEAALLPCGRLYYHDGEEAPPGGLPGRFRLLHESDGPDGERPLSTGLEGARLYEFVPGASVSGRSRPGGAVSVSVRLVSRTGRIFRFRAEGRADGEGRFALPVPYSTEGANGTTVPLGRAVVSSGSRTAAVAVTEGDVLRGGTVDAGTL
jgi:dolichyl-diphosphooligosaccharide--protein glycosyltransferase